MPPINCQISLLYRADQKDFYLYCYTCESTAIFPYGYDPNIPLTKAKDRGGMGMAQSKALTAFRAHVKLHTIGAVRTREHREKVKAMVRNQNVRLA